MHRSVSWGAVARADCIFEALIREFRLGGPPRQAAWMRIRRCFDHFIAINQDPPPRFAGESYAPGAKHMTKHSLIAIGRAGLTFEAPIREFRVTMPPRVMPRG